MYRRFNDVSYPGIKLGGPGIVVKSTVCHAAAPKSRCGIQDFN